MRAGKATPMQIDLETGEILEDGVRRSWPSGCSSPGRLGTGGRPANHTTRPAPSRGRLHPTGRPPCERGAHSAVKTVSPSLREAGRKGACRDHHRQQAPGQQRGLCGETHRPRQSLHTEVSPAPTPSRGIGSGCGSSGSGMARCAPRCWQLARRITSGASSRSRVGAHHSAATPR